jgi:hypothetical protein
MLDRLGQLIVYKYESNTKKRDLMEEQLKISQIH